MTPEAILAHPPLVLTQAQREFYFANGYLLVESLVDAGWLTRLRTVVAEKIEASRSRSRSDEEFDLDPAHTAMNPRIRRLRRAVDWHPDLWELARNSVVTEVAADLVGPDVKFHSSKLNFKWSHGGNEVKWHQDIQAWPHTNFSPLTIGVYLEDTGPEQGPLAVIPGSHKGPLFDQYDDDDVWTGTISDRDMAGVDTSKAVDLCGPAGSLAILNCRVIHGSRVNNSPQMRPLLLYVYASADALTISPAPTPTSHTNEIVRGRPARYVHMEPLDCRLPPDWAKVGYGSIYTVQSHEEKKRAAS